MRLYLLEIFIILKVHHHSIMYYVYFILCTLFKKSLIITVPFLGTFFSAYYLETVSLVATF